MAQWWKLKEVGEAYGSLVLMEDILTYSFCKTLKDNTGIEKLITLESRLGMNNHHKSIDYLLSPLFLFNYYSLFYYSIMHHGKWYHRLRVCLCVHPLGRLTSRIWLLRGLWAPGRWDRSWHRREMALAARQASASSDGIVKRAAVVTATVWLSVRLAGGHKYSIKWKKGGDRYSLGFSFMG